MTSMFARAVGAALVGFALAFGPNAISGFPDNQDEIPVKIDSWVKDRASEDLIKSLRSRVRVLTGKDEIGTVTVRITFFHDVRFNCMAGVVTLPTVRGDRCHMVHRQLVLTATGWNHKAGYNPPKSKDGDYDWKVHRDVWVNRTFEVDGSVAELMCDDAMSYAETHELLALVKRKGLVPGPDLEGRGKFKSPRIENIVTIEPRGENLYAMSEQVGELSGGTVFVVKRQAKKLIVVRKMFWAN